MQIKIFCGANNLFYLSKNSSLNHCHHPHLKSKAILCGQSNMETGDIDILTLLFSVNVTPSQISQIMEQLKGPKLEHLCQNVFTIWIRRQRNFMILHMDCCLIVMMRRKLFPNWKEAISTISISYTTILGCTHVLKVVLVMMKWESN